MRVAEIFQMQKQLDAYIEKNHQLHGDDLFNKKVLALLVELGELANETRCFKFWSLKAPSTKEVILEEFVDGVHFMLSLGIECGFDSIAEISAPNGERNGETTITDQFIQVFEAIQAFRLSRSIHTYEKMFQQYLTLARLLGFSDDEIKEAYIAKNEVNYKRQEEGY